MGAHAYIPRQVWLIAVVLFCFAYIPTSAAGDSVIAGSFDGKPAIISLEGYPPKVKTASWSLTTCYDGQNESSAETFSGNANWKLRQDGIELVGVGSLSSEKPDESGVVAWKGLLTMKGITALFEGHSSAKKGVAVTFGKQCPDEVPAPGNVAVLFKPKSKGAARKFFQSRGWRIAGRDTIIGNETGGRNRLLIYVPVGSEQKVIQEIKASGLVFDAARDLLVLTTPALGWVEIPRDALNQEARDSLQTELRDFVQSIWPDVSNPPTLAPRYGNTFDFKLRGPLSKFVAKPKLPGWWIEAKLQFLVDRLETSDRLLIGVREAKLIRWPETGRGEPQIGYGKVLDCEAAGELSNMDSVLAIEEKILDAASKRYKGKNVAAPLC